MHGSYIGRQRDGDVMVAKLSRGTTNAIDGAFVHELSLLLKQAGTDPEVRGLVLASANDKFFSIGFDIPSLYGLPRSEFEPFFDAFNRLCLDLYAFPKPTVAAITGHAVAGGCILALCCDRRIVAEGRNLMGLNTAKLGVPVPLVVECILKHLLAGRDPGELLARGAFYEPEEVRRLGLVEELQPAALVLRAAVDAARAFASAPEGAFTAAKRDRVARVLQEVEPRLAERNRAFVDAWYSPEARRLLRDAIARFRRASDRTS